MSTHASLPLLFYSSNLTFSLSPGWSFIETESWRPDLVASWAMAEDSSEKPGTGVRTSVCEGADPGMSCLARIHMTDVRRPIRWLDLHDRHVDTSPTGRSTERGMDHASTAMGTTRVFQGRRLTLYFFWVESELHLVNGNGSSGIIMNGLPFEH